MRNLIILSTTLLCAACGSSDGTDAGRADAGPPDAGPPLPFTEFEDISAEFPMIRDGGDGLAGLAILDYDDDGQLDVFFTNGAGFDNALYRNDGDGTFTDVTAEAGVASGTGHAGVTAADIDNDGDTDLFLTTDGRVLGLDGSPSVFFRNNGDGTFTDETDAVGLRINESALSAAFGDIDNDGFVDLFVTGTGGLSTTIQNPNWLFHNEGGVTFTDVSVAAGIDTALGACAASFSDEDGDGLIDLFVGNCNEVAITPTPIQLFRNNGDGTFTDVAPAAGADELGFWMGIAIGDIDNDLDLDLFSTNLGPGFGDVNDHVLLRNEGDGTYVNTAGEAGVGAFEFAFGCSLPDLDNDGWIDLVYVGSLPLPPFNVVGPNGNPGYIMANNRDGTFRQITDMGLQTFYTSGLATADLDNDGFPEIIVVRHTTADAEVGPVLWRNLGNDNGSVTVRLEGTTGNRDAIGARVTASAGDLIQVRERYAGSSVASSESPWLLFGIGERAGVDSFEVRWPGGTTEAFPGAAAGETTTLVEGGGS